MDKCILDFFNTEPTQNTTHVTKPQDLNRQLQSFFDKFYILIFYSKQDDYSVNVCETIFAISQLQPQIMFNFIEIEIETNEEILDFFKVSIVPSIYFITAMKNVQFHLESPDITNLQSIVEQQYSIFQENFKVMRERMFPQLKQLLTENQVMVFIKGSPDNPKCGFTRQFLAILKQFKIQFNYFDILQDQNVREWLKFYSNWKSYPQLYINQKLIGGLDVCKDLVQNNKFISLFPQSSIMNAEYTLQDLMKSEQALLVTNKLIIDDELGLLLQNNNVDFKIVDISNDDDLVNYCQDKFQLPFVIANQQMIGGYQQVKGLVDTNQLVQYVGEKNFFYHQNNHQIFKAKVFLVVNQDYMHDNLTVQQVIQSIKQPIQYYVLKNKDINQFDTLLFINGQFIGNQNVVKDLYEKSQLSDLIHHQ